VEGMGNKYSRRRKGERGMKGVLQKEERERG
jgi:hypothetical protein